MTHILFIINGLGMGNSTRCHSIIEQLREKDAKVTVISSGNGAKYFKGLVSGVYSVHEVGQMHYGSRGGAISIFDTLLSLPKYAKTLNENAALIDRVISEDPPNVVVIDSTYVTKPMRRRKIPIVGINNSDYVFRNYFKMAELPPVSTLPQFLFVEFMDFLFHLFFADVVLSPSLFPSESKRFGKFKIINPLVRCGYDPSEPKDEPTKGMIMLSGSAFGSHVNPGFNAHGLHIDVIGRDTPDNWAENENGILFHGKLFDNKKLVGNADLAVVNCGYSAVSESVHMQKPLVVVPVPNHAEQWVNAKMVEKFGLGVAASEDRIDDAIYEVKKKYKAHIDAFKNLFSGKAATPGSKQAADIILELASSS